MVQASKYGLPESFPIESEVTISFSAIGGSASGGEDLGGSLTPLGTGKTELTVYYPDISGIEGDMLKNMTQGWNETLDKLAKQVLKN
ncbi:MAG: hypothetical protein P4L74_05695 [Candidatus Doudnabacteria bacterium]|nr:hypothetical protein [Candidatus Doudnabacteria bacterium]